MNGAVFICHFARIVGLAGFCVLAANAPLTDFWRFIGPSVLMLASCLVCDVLATRVIRDECARVARLASTTATTTQGA